MTSREDARKLAEDLLDAEVRPDLDEEIVIPAEYIQESERFWILFYNTRIYVETGSLSHALAGNGPILVEKATGTARLGRSDIPWEQQVAD